MARRVLRLVGAGSVPCDSLKNQVSALQGSVQLFYRDLPLSIQEAYEILLSQEAVSLPHYQVCWENEGRELSLCHTTFLQCLRAEWEN